MRDDPAVIDLVTRARTGDQSAWNDLVARYAALVWGICRRIGLRGADVDEAGSAVWLQLVENLDRLAEPAALPGWLATTTRRECLAVLRRGSRQVPVDDPDLVGRVDAVERATQAEPVEAMLLAQERRHALRLALLDLPERCRRLLAMLFGDPPTAYADIGAALDMPVGAIGPNRRRCLDRLRRSDALAGLEQPV